MPRSSWSSIWDLAAAQAQMEAISAALMPVGLSPSGRLQVPAWGACRLGRLQNP
ncbi:MAG TPA: hypothetical protein IGR64_13115 [Leptolyngbyaceae cyanobacterium M65_K2018_010]|nr:hypothetical protein [Leptolyngbyaceae cyanobacterium M65_K2018_010]